MKVIIMGAGLLGVTSAYFLAREGFSVTVIDRQGEPAKETSFANAGLISPGHAYAWDSPQAPITLLRSLWNKDTALKLRLRLDPAMWAWGLKFLRHCTNAAYQRHTLTKLKLCLYSQQQTDLISETEQLDWHRTKAGILYLFRDQRQFDVSFKASSLLTDRGVVVQKLNRDEVLACEPALKNATGKILGGLFTPNDETGDARLFTVALAEKCRKLGVEFQFNTHIVALHHQGGRIDHVKTNQGAKKADHYVLALGSYSPLLGRQLKLKLPIYPVKGYSVTVPLRDAESAPRRGGVDETYLVAFSRLGDRLRITSTAEFSGYNSEFTPGDFSHMLGVAKGLFPKAGHYDQPNYWACLRPTTSDGPPVIGPTPYTNLWLNTGHGHLGWTMAAGSSRILADMMVGKNLKMDISGLTYDRFC